VKQAIRDSAQGDDDQAHVSDLQQARTRGNDDDDQRPSRRQRIGQEGNWMSGAARAEAPNPTFQQLAADALREYQECRAEVSHALQRRHGSEVNQEQEPLPFHFPSHIQGQEEPDSGFESSLIGSPTFDLLRAAAHPQERQEATEEHQGRSYPPGRQLPGQDDADDSKPAAL
jgi:hypothetical protein